MRRAALLIAFVAFGGALLAACGGDDSSSSSSTTSSTSSSTSTSVPASTAATAAATTTVPGPPTCQTSALAAQISPPDAGAGQRNSVLVFTNNGTGPCTMNGYVGLQLQSQNGQAIPTTVVRGQGPSGLVTLQVGGQSYTTLQWGVIPSGNEDQNGPCEADPARDRDHVTERDAVARAAVGQRPRVRAGHVQHGAGPVRRRPAPTLIQRDFSSVGAAGASARVGCGAASRHTTRRT